MKQLWLIVLTFALNSQAAGQVAWEEGKPEQVFAQAHSDGKNILLFWTATWCLPCAEFKATVLTDRQVESAIAGFHAVYLDADADASKAWEPLYPAEGYPSVFVVAPDGRVLEKVKSGIDGTSFAKVLLDYKDSAPHTRDLVADFRSELMGQWRDLDVISALAKNWCYEVALPPFRSKEEKTCFYNKLYDLAKPLGASLAGRAYLQLLKAYATLNAELPAAQTKKLRDDFQKIVSDASSLRPIARGLSFQLIEIHRQLGLAASLPQTLHTLTTVVVDQGNALTRADRLVLAKILLEAEKVSSLQTLDKAELANLLQRYAIAFKVPAVRASFSDLERRDLIAGMLALGQTEDARGIAELSLQDGFNRAVFLDWVGQAYEKDNEAARALHYYEQAALVEGNLGMKAYRVETAIAFAAEKLPSHDEAMATFLTQVITGLPVAGDEGPKLVNRVLKTLYAAPNVQTWLDHLRVALANGNHPLATQAADALRSKSFLALDTSPVNPRLHTTRDHLLAVVKNVALWFTALACFWLTLVRLKGRSRIGVCFLAMLFIITFYKVRTPAKDERITWNAWDKQAMTKVQEDFSGLALLNVTEDWCLTCQWNEKTLFSSSEFSDLVESHHIALYKANVTQRNQEIEALLRAQNKAGVPAYFVIVPGERFMPLPELVQLNDIKRILDSVKVPI